MPGGRGRGAQTAQPRPDHSAGAETWPRSLVLMPEASNFSLGNCHRCARDGRWLGGDSGNEPSDDRAPISRPRPTARITTRCLPELFTGFVLLVSGKLHPNRPSPALFALRMEHNEAGLSIVQDFEIAILILCS